MVHVYYVLEQTELGLRLSNRLVVTPSGPDFFYSDKSLGSNSGVRRDGICFTYSRNSNPQVECL